MKKLNMSNLKTLNSEKKKNDRWVLQDAGLKESPGSTELV